jgi:hypothetical protein
MVNWKSLGRKQAWPNLGHYPNLFLEGLRKITKNLSNNGRSPDRDLNRGHPKYEAGVLITQSDARSS